MTHPPVAGHGYGSESGFDGGDLRCGWRGGHCGCACAVGQSPRSIALDLMQQGL